MLSLEEQLKMEKDRTVGMMNQRNAAQNECVELNAQLQAALRLAKALEEKLSAVATAPAADAPAAPVLNGLHTPA